MKKAFSTAGFTFRVVLLAAVLFSIQGYVGSVMAADLIWSGNNASDGNAGTWDTTNAHWSTTSGGPYTTVWSNSPVNNAILQGTPGTMTTGAAVTVNLITINTALAATTNSWVLGNSTTLTTNKITFSGAGSGINANYSTGTTWLRNAAQGTLTKTGAGRVEIDNTSMGITQYFINAGSLTIPNVNRLGAAPGSLVPDFFTFDGGGLGVNTATVASDLGATRGVKVLAGGAFFSTTATTVIPTISAPIIGTAGGNVTIGGNPAVWSGSGHTSGGVWTISNTSNSWDGNLVLNGASGTSVKLGASGVIPDTAVVTMSAAGNTFNLNGFDETVKSVSGTAGTIAVGVKTLTLDNPNGESFTSVFTGTAGGQVIKNGAGLLTLSGGSSGFSGEFVVNNGTIGVGGTGVFGSNAAGPQLTMNGGTLSNTAATGRTMSANLSVNISGDFAVDDSQFATPGQISFSNATIKGGNHTITVNGAANLAFTGVVGEDAAGRSLTKAGNGILVLNNAANSYSGDTTISGGILRVNGSGTLGTGVGTAFLSGGALDASASRNGAAAIANPIKVTANSSITSSSGAATPIFEFSGTLEGTAGTTLTFQDNNNAATLFKPRFSGGTATMDSDISMLTGTGTLAATVQMESFNTTGTTQTFTGKISGTGSYNRSASSSGTGGKTVFTGDNTYDGGTTINDGTLLANNTTGSATGSGPVTVNGGGTLGGTGAVSGAVTVNSGGTLSPGASIESLGTGSVTFNAGSTFAYDVNTTSVTADLLNASGGSLSLDTTGAGVTLAISDLGGSIVPDGTKFTLISYNGTLNTGGIFVGTPDLSLLTISGKSFRIRYQDTSPGGNFESEATGSKFVTLTAVPELGSFITMGLVGCCALGAARFGKRFGFKALGL